MAKVLVTGGAGFIGSHISEKALERGDTVVVLDNLSTGKQENLAHLESLGKDLKIIKGDVSDSQVVKRAMEGVEVVFHQAALGSVPKSVLDPISSHHANITGTVEMLLAAKNAGVKQFVVAASSSAYGETPELPKVETMYPNPLSPYAVTKLAQEQYCRAFYESYGLKTVSLRYFNVYGSRQDPTSQYAAVIPKFYQSFLNGEAPTIYGDGEQTRDFTYIDDVVQANFAAAAYDGAAGQIFNIAGGKRISVNELGQRIAKIVGVDIQPKHVDARPGDIRHSLADITAAKRELGFDPKTSLEQGLEACAAWYRSYFSKS